MKAASGLVFPIFYKGSIIKIDEKDFVEIDLGQLLYEPKIQFLEGLVKKHLVEMGEK